MSGRADASRGSRAAKARWRPGATTLVPAALVVLLLLRIAFAPFNIPSGSMAPTLLPGDTIVVSTLSYGFSHNSLPFAPNLFSGRIFGSLPRRGDVVVFKSRNAGNADWVKRVVGLPGDHVRITAGRLVLNGQRVDRWPAGAVQLDEGGVTTNAAEYVETMPGGPGYLIAKLNDSGPQNDTPDLVVPDATVFVLGDNRDNSLDSRFAPDSSDPNLRMPEGPGFVPVQDLVGRAAVVVVSVASGPGHPARIRWDRSLASVR